MPTSSPPTIHQTGSPFAVPVFMRNCCGPRSCPSSPQNVRFFFATTIRAPPVIPFLTVRTFPVRRNAYRRTSAAANDSKAVAFSWMAMIVGIREAGLLPGVEPARSAPAKGPARTIPPITKVKTASV